MFNKHSKVTMVGGVIVSKDKASKIRELTILAVLTAIMLVITIAPVGFPVLGVVRGTIMAIPVAVGAAVTKTMRGAIYMGVMFGIASFLQIVFNPMHATIVLWGLNPLFYTIMCIVPRVGVGVVAGLTTKLVNKTNKLGKYSLVGFATSLSNSILFLTFMFLLFLPYVGTAVELESGGMGSFMLGSVFFFVPLIIFEAIAAVVIVEPLMRAINKSKEIGTA